MNSWSSVVHDLVHRMERDVAAVLDGLDPLLLDVPARPGTNTIGGLVGT